MINSNTIQTLSKSILNGSPFGGAQPTKPKKSIAKTLIMMIVLVSLIGGGYLIYQWTTTVDGIDMGSIKEKISEAMPGEAGDEQTADLHTSNNTGNTAPGFKSESLPVTHMDEGPKLEAHTLVGTKHYAHAKKFRHPGKKSYRKHKHAGFHKRGLHKRKSFRKARHHAFKGKKSLGHHGVRKRHHKRKHHLAAR